MLLSEILWWPLLFILHALGFIYLFFVESCKKFRYIISKQIININAFSSACYSTYNLSVMDFILHLVHLHLVYSEHLRVCVHIDPMTNHCDHNVLIGIPN